jgi:hypothetical protein
MSILLLGIVIDLEIRELIKHNAMSSSLGATE